MVTNDHVYPGSDRRIVSSSGRATLPLRKPSSSCGALFPMTTIPKSRPPRWALVSVASLIAFAGAACGDPETKTKTQPGEVTTTTTAPTATSTTVKAVTTTTGPAATTTTVKATTTTTRAVTTTTAKTVSYANCTAVKAAGAAPIRRGEPGYSTSLDRDGDGIACET